MSRVLRMLKSASGPLGTWSAGYQYGVPGHMPLAEAEGFIAVGAAEWIAGATEPKGPSPGGRTTMEGPNRPNPEPEDEGGMVRTKRTMTHPSHRSRSRPRPGAPGSERAKCRETMV
jgi:hypothetical protein